MKRKAPPPPASTPYQRALRRLARRDHSEGDLRRSLLEDGFGASEVNRTLRRLRAERYLDDAGFALRFAHSRLAHHGLGRHRIRQSLRERGVGRAQAEDGIAQALKEHPEAEAIDRLARRYWGQWSKIDPRRRLHRLWALLLRRGFPATLVSERLRVLWPKWHDALEGLEPMEAEEEAGGAESGEAGSEERRW